MWSSRCTSTRRHRLRVGIGYWLGALTWTSAAWAPPATSTPSGVCSVRKVDLSGYPNDVLVPTNFLVPLSWGCPGVFDIPGSSWSTLFPELVLEDGTVLGQYWVETFGTEILLADTSCPDSHISTWQGPRLPPNSTIRVRSHWDRTCLLQSAYCPSLPSQADCTLSDSCCHLDDAAGQYSEDIATFRTGPGDDLTPPEPPVFTVACTTTISSAEERNTVVSISHSFDGTFWRRYYVRRSDEPASSERVLGIQTPTGALNMHDGPFPSLRGGEMAYAPLAGTWVLTAEAMDYAGNLSTRSEAVSLQYPDNCKNWAPWTSANAGAGGTSASAEETGSADESTTGGVTDAGSEPDLDALAVAGSRTKAVAAPPSARSVGGGGCRIATSDRSGSVTLLLALALGIGRLRRRLSYLPVRPVALGERRS
jgi:hypothetical protein